MNTTVREIQHYLRTLSFRDNRLYPITIDGIYSPQTKEAVEVFQRLYGLPVNGEVDSDTWDALVVENAANNTPIINADIFTHTDSALLPNTKSELASFVQIMINTLAEVYENIAPVHVTGIYDVDTVKQIQTLQALHGQEQNGIIDLKTWNILASLFNTRSSVVHI